MNGYVVNPDPKVIRLPSVPKIASMTSCSVEEVLLILSHLELGKHGNKCAFQTDPSDSSE